MDAGSLGEPAPFSPHPSRAELWRFTLVLVGLIVVFFPDVIFLGKTVSSSSFQYGVMGAAPPYRFPDIGSTQVPRLFEGGSDYNYYLADPLASAVGSEPMAKEISRSLRDLRVPLWSSTLGGGHPLMATWSVDALSPLRLPLMLAPNPISWDVFLLSRLLATGLFAYLFARRLGLLPLSAGLVGIGFTFSGSFMLLINMPHVDYAMLLPAVLYAVDLLVERGTPLRLAFGALVLALAILADNPRTAGVVLLLAGAYGLFRLLSTRPRGRRLWSAPGVHVGAMILLGLGLTMWAVLPALEFSGMFGFPDRVAGGTPRGLRVAAFRRLVTQVIPFLEGAPTYGFRALGTEVEGYVGAALPMLALLGVMARRSVRGVRWFFLGVLIFSWGKMYGVPVLQWIGDLPVLQFINFEKYLPPVATLSVAMLAGLGSDAMLRRGWEMRRVLIVVLAFAAGVAGFLFLNGKALRGIPAAHVILQGSIAGAAIVAVGTLAILNATRVLRGRMAALALISVLAVELLVATFPVKAALLPPPIRSAYRSTGLPILNRAPRYDPFTEPPFVSFLKRDPSTFRIFGLDRVLYPNTAFAYDLQDIRVFFPLTIDRYWSYIQEFVNPSLTGRFTGAEFFGSEELPPRLAANPMLDLLNVKYVLTASGRQDLLPEPQFELVHRSGSVSVFRNRQVVPRAFLVHEIRSASSIDQAFSLMRAPGFDPTSTAIVEGYDGEPLGGSDGLSSVELRVHEDDSVILDVSSDRPGLLVVTDSWYPGWVASVDGVETPIYPADVAFRGVRVPAGRHVVEFAYRPGSFLAGTVIACVAMFSLLLYAVVTWRRSSRRRPDRSDHAGTTGRDDPAVGNPR